MKLLKQMRPIKRILVKCDRWENARQVEDKIAVFSGRRNPIYSTDDGLLYKKIARMTMDKKYPDVLIIYDGEMTDIMPMLIRLLKDEYEMYEYKYGTDEPWLFLKWCFGKITSYNPENGYIDPRVKREGKPSVDWRLEIMEILIEMKNLNEAFDEGMNTNTYWHKMQELVNSLESLVC